LAVFGLFAAALAWIAYSLQAAARNTQQELARLLPAEQPAPMAERVSREASLASRAEGVSNPRMDLLRTQVDRLSARLNRLSELLEQKTAEYDALKTEFDQNNELLRDLLTLEQKPAARKPDLQEIKPDADKAEAAAEMAETVARLNAELREARAELAALEKEAALDDLHIFELEESKHYFESAAADALVRSGETAVPALLDLLLDRRAEIRYWAATLLGRIGPDAESAVDALHDALSDTNEEVRNAARIALRRIERP
jgi:HEAT repeat protein